MSSLSLLGLVFFMVVMIGAFAVRSVAGFGAVLIAMPMLAFVLPISHPAPRDLRSSTFIFRAAVTRAKLQVRVAISARVP